MKKIIILLITMTATIVLALQASAQLRQYLHEGWTFGQSRLPNRYPAVVPGVVHTG